jgi:hypothetical protein
MKLLLQIMLPLQLQCQIRFFELAYASSSLFTKMNSKILLEVSLPFPSKKTYCSSGHFQLGLKISSLQRPFDFKLAMFDSRNLVIHFQLHRSLVELS